jgi:hypothetical protein
MEKLYGEGIANHTGPEPCAGDRKSVGEASAGVCAGRVLSRERTSLRGADALRRSGRPHRTRRYRKTRWNPARSETPHMRRCTSRENREIPCLPVADGAAGRVGKSKDVHRR